MRKFQVLAALLTLFAALTGWTAGADIIVFDSNTEVHAIGVYEANLHVGGKVVGPLINVTVTRPGVNVVLALMSYSPVRWQITTTPGTNIARIVLGRSSPDRSEVYVDGVVQDRVEHIDLPGLFDEYSPDIPAESKAVALRLSVPALASFQGAYTARKAVL